MTLLASLLRLVLVAALVAGFAMPAAAATSAPQPMAQMHTLHQAPAPAHSMPLDDACRAHCLGVSLLTPTITPPPKGARVAPLHVVELEEDEPSLWPQPEGRPPRA